MEQIRPSDEVNVDEDAFDAAMMEIFQRAKNEVGFFRESYFKMLHEKRGVETARILIINSEHARDGFGDLWLRGRLDLTVEALVLQPRWQALFAKEPEILQRARERIEEASAVQMPEERWSRHRRRLDIQAIRARHRKG